jgi:hypothetical protein
MSSLFRPVAVARFARQLQQVIAQLEHPQVQQLTSQLPQASLRATQAPPKFVKSGPLFS